MRRLIFRRFVSKIRPSLRRRRDVSLATAAFRKDVMEDSLDVGAILEIKRRALATLADLSRSPKPTCKVDGLVVSWREYRESLLQTIDWCDRRLNAFNAFELRSHGIVD